MPQSSVVGTPFIPSLSSHHMAFSTINAENFQVQTASLIFSIALGVVHSTSHRYLAHILNSTYSQRNSLFHNSSPSLLLIVFFSVFVSIYRCSVNNLGVILDFSFFITFINLLTNPTVYIFKTFIESEQFYHIYCDYLGQNSIISVLVFSHVILKSIKVLSGVHKTC